MRTGHRFGITGHQNLPSAVRTLIRRHLKQLLADDAAPIGYTALAAGADQLFAEEVLQRDGSLVAVVPSADYERTFKSAEDLENYRALLGRAGEVVRMDFETASEHAYWAAGQEVVRRCETLIAVWDGKKAGGLGGTADVVEFSRSLDREVQIVWPTGARRA